MYFAYSSFSLPKIFLFTISPDGHLSSCGELTTPSDQEPWSCAFDWCDSLWVCSALNTQPLLQYQLVDDKVRLVSDSSLLQKRVPGLADQLHIYYPVILYMYVARTMLVVCSVASLCVRAGQLTIRCKRLHVPSSRIQVYSYTQQPTTRSNPPRFVNLSLGGNVCRNNNGLRRVHNTYMQPLM